uniref:G_PROTEIN_RECEP_F1_2 domain-containing protein n=1 Tax=Caenorhabditis tropicalis TaxID=1561998 RepID=A0A1I7UPZ3_9PELO
MSDSSQHLRLALTVTHLLLVALGSVNLIVILLIITRPYLRSITNVYMIGLCLADFIYLADLILVAATSLNGKSWPFGPTICHLFHGTEATGKYASVLFVVLLAADRYIAMCKSDLCGRYRTYRTAIFLSGLAWIAALICSLPLYVYADEIKVRMRPKNGTDAIENNHTLCIAHWPSPPHAQWNRPLPMPEDIRSTSASTYYRNSSNLDGLKSSLPIKSPMEAPSVYQPEEESPVDSAEKMEMERKKAELQAWRPYDGTNCEVLEVQYDHHKCSARSILLPAVTIDEGTKL